MFNSQRRTRTISRIALFTIIGAIALSITAAGSNAAGFSFMDSVKEFFGIATTQTSAVTAQPEALNSAPAMELMSPLAGTTLLVEDFNYTATDLISAHGWTAHSGAGTNAITVASPGLTYSGYPSSGIGNTASMTTSGEDDNKTFTSQSSGTVYAAAMVNLSASQTTGDYFFHLYLNSSTFYGRVYAKKDPSSTNYALGIAKFSGAPNYTAFNYAINTTHLVVIKYTFVAGATNDTVDLFIDPTLNGVEPAVTISATDGSLADVTSLVAAALRQGTAGSMPTAKVDGVRVGTTWEATTALLKYRSVASGNWNATSTWESSNDGSTWVAATSTPTSADDTITIQNTHTVTNTANLIVDQVTVDFGGTLAITTQTFQNNGAMAMNGTMQMGFAGSFTGTTAPTYGGSSLLKYNSTGGFNRGLEWSATSGAGFPKNVQISNNTTFDLFYISASEATAIGGGLTIDSGSTFEMTVLPMTAALTVNESVINNGTLTLSTASGGDMVVKGAWTNANIFTPNGRKVTFNGNNNTQSLSGATTFADLTINHTGGGGVTAEFSTLNVNGTLTVTSGTFISASNFGNVFIDVAGTLQATSGSTINVSGNWTNLGTFTANGSSVIFAGGTGQTLNGNTTFYNLTKSTGGAHTINFERGKTQTVTNTLTLEGTVGNLLSLRGVTAGPRAEVAPQWKLNASALQTVNYVDVQDSDASGGATINPTNSVNSGNNTNWNLATTYTYTGTGSWTTVANWSPSYPGTAIAAADTAVIAAAANLTSSTSVIINGTLTVNSTAVFSLTGASTLAVASGSIINNNGELYGSGHLVDLQSGSTFNNTGIFGIAGAVFGAGSSLTNNTPGTLVMFGGSATGNLTNGTGTVQQQLGGGTASLAGNFNNGTGKYQIYSFNSSVGRMDVTGTATIGGSTFDYVPSGNTPAIGTQNIVLHSDAGISGTFTNNSVPFTTNPIVNPRPSSKANQKPSSPAATAYANIYYTSNDAVIKFEATPPDTTPPATPSISGSTPTSPNSSTTPTINGTAEALSNVKLYATADCSGSVLASGAATGGGIFNIPVTVPANTATTITATATDAAANVSPCSGTFSYTNDSIAPTVAYTPLTAVGSTGDRVFTVTATDAVGLATVKVYWGNNGALTGEINNTCGFSGGTPQNGTWTCTIVAAFGSPVQTNPGTVDYYVEALDVATNRTANPNGAAPALVGPRNLFTVGSGGTLDVANISTFENVFLGDGFTLINGNASVSSNLTLGGIFNTGANTLTIGSAGAVNGASPTSYVNGNLRKTFAAASVKGFEVGTANAYSPVSVTPSAGTFPADFTVKAVQGPHPNIPNAAFALARYWTLTGTGITASLNFNYNDIDVPGTANENNFVIQKYSAGFTQPGGTVTPASNQASITGVSSFSDWTLAEPAAFGTPETDVSVSGGVLSVTDANGGTSNDNLTISCSGSIITITDPGNTITAGAGATQNGTNSVTVPVGSVTADIMVNTLGGNDTLTLNFSGCDFIPGAATPKTEGTTGFTGLTYNGGTQGVGGSDKLVITGGTFTTATHNFNSANDGSINLAGTGTITYTGLEPVDTTGSTINDLVFNFNGGAETITLTDAAGANMTIDSPLSESTTFADPSGSITINAGTGIDIVNITSVDTDGPFNAALTINGDAGDDTVNLNADITFASGNSLNVDLQNDSASPGIDTVNTGSNANLITSGAGTITVTASRNVAMASGSSFETENGALTVEANQQAIATTGDFMGVRLDGALLKTKGTGAISVKGKGGADAGNPFHRGINVNASSTVSSTLNSAGAGTITLDGRGALGTASNAGVEVFESAVSSVRGNILITGVGSANGSSSGVRVIGNPNPASVSSSGAATITINGTGGAGTNDCNGVFISGNANVTGNTGDILITGQGGGSGVSFNNIGVRINAGALVDGSSSGAKVTINGTGGSGTQFNVGIFIAFQSSTLVPARVMSGAGDISITGTAGTGSTNFNIGINIGPGAQVLATGNAAVDVIGTGGPGTNDNYGIGFEGGNIPGTAVSAVNGNITMTGISTDATGTNQDGVRFEDSVAAQAVAVNTTGTGTLTITGTAGNATNASSSGIKIVDDTTMLLTGATNTFIADKMDIGTSNVSINAGANAFTLRQKTTGNPIILGGADSFARPAENSPEATTNLGLTDAELDVISAGTMNIGNANSGAISFSGASPIDVTDGPSIATLNLTTGAAINSNGSVGVLDVIASNLNLVSGPGIDIEMDAGTVTTSSANLQSLRELNSVTVGNNDINASGFTLTLAGGRFNTTVGGGFILANSVQAMNGATIGGTGSVTTGGSGINAQSGSTVSPGLSPGILNTGNVTFSAGSTFDVEINGTTPGNTATDHDQLNVTGTVSLGNATLNLSGTHTPVGGQTFKIINNDDNADPVTGTFTMGTGGTDANAGTLAEGDTITNFLGSSLSATISYAGGSGSNDVVLSVVNPCVPPATTYVGENSVSDFTITTDVGPAGLSAGDTVTWNPGGTQHPAGQVANLIFGCAAFTTVQGGVDGVTAGGTVNVTAGTYDISAQLNIAKGLTITGANLGISGNSVRGAESLLNGAATGISILVNTTSLVTIDGIKFAGNSIREHISGESVKWKNSIFDATPGTSGATPGLFVSNPVIFEFTDNKVLTDDNLINFIQVMGNYPGSGVNSPVNITGNQFNGTGSPNVNAVSVNVFAVQGTIGNNTFDGVDIGILLANNTGNLAVTGNTFKNIARGPAENAAASYGAGILFFQPSFTNTVMISGNLFQNSDTGIRISSAPPNNVAGLPITIGTNTFTNNIWSFFHFGTGELGLAGTNIFDGVTLSSATLSQLYTIADDIVDGVDLPGKGLVRIKPANVYVTPNSFYSYTSGGPQGTTTPNVQRAVDVATASDVINVKAGAYTGNVDATTKSITLSAGASPGQVTINGNLVLDSNDTVPIEINGVNAATDYDNFIVNGTVTLGNAALSLSGTHTPAVGQTFTIINNDDNSDPVVGTFNGLAEGATIANFLGSSLSATITYVGGSGSNDVVLTVFSPCVTPATTYVGENSVSDFTITTDVGPAGLSAGDTVTWNPAGAQHPAGQVPGLIFGCQAFTAIQGGVDGVQTGGTVNVEQGQYNEAQVLVIRSMTVTGAGFATTNINGMTSALASAGTVRLDLPLGQGNVIFQGFTTINPGITGGLRYHVFAKHVDPASTITVRNNQMGGTVGGTPADYAFYAYQSRGPIVFNNNQLINNTSNAILLENPIGASASTNIHHNTITGNASTAIFAMAYSANDVTALQRIADNTFDGTLASSISINGGFGSSTGKFTNVQITDNVITNLGGAAARTGIALNNGATMANQALGAIENPVVTGNKITGTLAANSIGVRTRGLIVSPTINGNDIRSLARGISVEVGGTTFFATGTQAHFNNLVNNTAGINLDSAVPLDAENNWWGCNFGPGAGGAGCTGTANGVTGVGAASVDSNPWIVLGASASPAAIPPLGNSTITADMRFNSGAVNVSGSGTIPSTPVAWNATNGSMAPPTGTITLGLANSTFTSANSSAGTGCATVDNQNTCANVAILQADLSITKTDGVTTATPGGSVTYTITASNAGPNPAPVATVADTFPAILTCSTTSLAAGGASGNTAGPFAGNINDNALNMPASSSVTYTSVCTINASATGTLANTATVSSTTLDPVPGNNSATDTDTLTPQANLAITKTDGVATAVPGGSVTYTITASNAGPSNAPGSNVSDTFPAAITGVNWTCAGAGGGTCTAAGSGNINQTVNLPVGSSVTFTAVASISAAATGSLANTATTATGGGVTDPTPGNNSATDTDTLTPQANLGITKTDGVTTVNPGGSTTYTITASNAGPSNAPGSNVSDTFPAQITGVNWTCVGAGGGTCTASGSGNINDTVNLPAGGSVTYTAVAAISGAAFGTIANTATVAAGGGVTDPTPGNNSATDTDTVNCVPNPIVINNANTGAGSLRIAVAQACPGSNITFNMNAGFVVSPILLSGGQITIDKNLTITGPGAATLTVQNTAAASPTSRVFSVNGGVTATVSGLTITGGNTSTGNGGAIDNFGTLTLTGTVITGNNAGNTPGPGGGGISNQGTLNLNSSTVSNNTTMGGGGGLLMVNGGTTNITESTFSGNTGNSAGAILAQSFAPGSGGLPGNLTVTNSTISGNTAISGTPCGGIWVLGALSTATITSTTITNNTGTFAGGVCGSGGTVTVRSSIIAGNVNNATVPDVENTFTSQGYNLIGNADTATGFTQPTDQKGTGISVLNPRIAPLGNNGGPTQTHALCSAASVPHASCTGTSPAIDKGKNAIVPLTTDQRGPGFARTFDNPAIAPATGGDNTDIGAYEVSNTPPSISASAPLSRQQGTAAINSQIATVSDPDQAANTLTVTSTPASGTGVTVTGIAIDAGGNVTANVAASCTATNSTFTLTVTDNAAASNTATLTVNVTANTPPVLTYNNPAAIVYGSSTTVNPATGPTDNGSVSTIVVQNTGTYTGTISVNAAGVVSISGAQPVGTHTITIRSTDNCGSVTDSQFVLVVGKANTTTVITNAAALASTATNSGQPYAVNFTVTPVGPGAGTPTGFVSVSDGTDICIGTVASGTCNLTSTTAGVKTITATYLGDSNFNSSSGTATHTVLASISGNIQQFIPPVANLAPEATTPLAGVTVSITGTAPLPASTTTDANGNYSFSGLTLGGNYTVTPTMAGKSFDPLSRSYTNLTANVTNADFLAFAPTVPRELKEVNAFTYPGQPAVMQIVLNGLGNEKTWMFSLNFNINHLAAPVVTCGSSDAGCAIATDTSQPGKIGITVTPATQLAAGPRNIATVTFQTFLSEPPNTPVTFGDAPTPRLTTDANGNPLQTAYTNGFVVFGGGYEGDVAGRPNGSGEAPPANSVNTSDITQVALFVAGTNTAGDQNTNEFQRADSAPSGLKGDGAINSSDIVQTARFAAGLDGAPPSGPGVPAGGPFGPLPGPPPLPRTERSENETAKTPRTMRVVSTTASPGGDVAVTVELDSRGDEVASSFTLNFDPARLTISGLSSPEANPDVSVGADAPAGTGVVVNAAKAARGQIGIVVFNSSLVPFSRATGRQMVTLNFHVTRDAESGPSPITFGDSEDSATNRSLSDGNANPLKATYVDGEVNIIGTNTPGSSISGRVLTSDGNGIRNAVVVLTDPQRATRQAVTGSLGRFRFEEVSAGETYVISVSSKSYRFAPQTVSAGTDLADVTITADPGGL